MPSSNEKSFAQLVNEVSEQSRVSIADTFYDCLENNNLQQIANLFAFLATEIEPKFSQPRLYISEPELESPQATATQYYESQVRGPTEEVTNFQPGILNYYLLVLRRILKENELKLDPAELSQALRNFSELVFARNSAIAALQMLTLQKEEHNPNMFFMDEEEEKLSDEISLQQKQELAIIRSKHKVILGNFLDEISDQSLLIQDCIKAMIVVLNDICKKEEIVKDSASPKSAEEKTDVELLNIVKNPEKEPTPPHTYPSLLLSDRSKAGNFFAVGYQEYKGQLTSMREKANQQLLADWETLSASPGPDSPLLDESKTADETLNSASRSLAQETPAFLQDLGPFLPLSQEILEANEKAQIIKSSLIEFAMEYYVNDDPALVRVASQLLQELNLLEANKDFHYSLPHLTKTFIPEAEDFLKTSFAVENTQDCIQQISARIEALKTKFAKDAFKINLLVEIEDLLCFKNPVETAAEIFKTHVPEIEKFKNKYTYEALKKKVLADADVFLSQVHHLCASRKRNILKREFYESADLRLKKIPHIKTQVEPERGAAYGSSYNLVLFILDLRSLAMRIELSLKKKLTAEELQREELAKTFIYNITAIDLEKEEPEIEMKDLFAKFIKDFSGCNDTEIEDLYKKIIACKHEVLKWPKMPEIENKPASTPAPASSYWWPTSLSIFGGSQNTADAAEKQKLKDQQRERLITTFSPLRV